MQYLENTSQQDVSCRRKLFNISDHVELTSEFVMRFIASDSTTVGEYLDGGSLVEGALDDVILYDAVAPDNSTSDLAVNLNIIVIPNPASDIVIIEKMLGLTPVKIYDANGALVFEGVSSENGMLTIDVNNYATGVYSVETRNSKARKSVVKLVKD